MPNLANVRNFITEEDFRWLGRQMLEAKGPDQSLWDIFLRDLTDVARAQWPDGFPDRGVHRRPATVNFAEVFGRDIDPFYGKCMVKRMDSWIAHYKGSGCSPMARFVRAAREYFLVYVNPGLLDTDD